MREVPTAGSSVAIGNGNGGGEVSDGTDDPRETEPAGGSVGVSPDSDEIVVESEAHSVRCPGGVAI